MAYLNRTSRLSDGEHIEGRWRHIFIKNGSWYELTTLTVYADGLISCEGFYTFDVFEQRVRSGEIATSLEQGAEVHAHELASWRFDQPQSALTPEMLIAEVADELEELAGRPTTGQRFRTALEQYLEEPDDAHLVALREAYLAVPVHRRIYLLGDQDMIDVPLRLLITPEDEPLLDYTPADDLRLRVLRDREGALRYFHERRTSRQQAQATVPYWEDDMVVSDPSIIRFAVAGGDYPYLANDYPAPIVLPEGIFPSVEHAYWALGTTDEEARAAIVAEPTGYFARKRARDVPMGPDWNVIRLAVMLRLLREKYRQHPDLAARLIATGDGRILDTLNNSQYWGTRRTGRNWSGRLLEVVRAELVAGILTPEVPADTE